MNDMLDKSWLKIIKICISVYAVIWMVMFIIFFCLCLFSKDWYQYPVLIWPFIHISTVLHSYELYRAYDEEGAAKLLAKVKGLDLITAGKIIKYYYEDARKSNYSFG